MSQASNFSFLLTRQLFVQGSNVLVAIFLSRTFSISDFAYYSIFNSIILYFQMFGDFGLSASLVRQPLAPNESDYKSVFTFQQLLAIILFVATLVLGKSILSTLRIPLQYEYIVYAIGFNFLFMSSQSVCTARLEKTLNFKSIAIIEVCQAVMFLISTIIVFTSNKNLAFLSIPILIRGLIGAVLSYKLSNASLGLVFDLKNIRSRIAFSIFFQGTNIVFLIQTLIVPIILLPLLGAKQTGIIVWAQSIATYPILLISSFQRMYFPVLANCQDDKEKTNREISWFLAISNISTAFLLFGFLVNGKLIVTHLFGLQWLEALNVVPFFLVGTFFVATSSPLFTLLNAQGGSRNAFSISIVWTVLMWVVSLLMINYFGFLGYTIGYVLVQLTNFPFWLYMAKQIKARIVLFVMIIWTIPTLVYFFVNQNPFTIKNETLLAILNNSLILLSILLSLFLVYRKKDYLINAQSI